MINTQSIKEHMEILGSDGQHVGAVDRLDGKDKIKLTKADLKSGSQHHVIPLAWVAKVDVRTRPGHAAGPCRLRRDWLRRAAFAKCRGRW
jgi:hypothetical protein